MAPVAQWVLGQGEELAKLIVNCPNVETRSWWLQQVIDGGDDEFFGRLLYWYEDFIFAPMSIEGVGKTTPLGYSAWRGQKAICERLLKEGAGWEEGRDRDRILALDLARRQGYAEVVELLKDLEDQEEDEA